MNRFLYFCFLVFPLLTSCERHYAIEDRARKQIAVSMEEELKGISPGLNSWRIEDLKTVYANDSICLLQCTARWRDSEDEKKVRDYRYIYLIDKQLSQMERRPVFKEEFRNVLCLPDKLIKKCRKDVKRNGENVYDDFIGNVFPVRRPFDKDPNGTTTPIPE